MGSSLLATARKFAEQYEAANRLDRRAVDYLLHTLGRTPPTIGPWLLVSASPPNAIPDPEKMDAGEVLTRARGCAWVMEDVIRGLDLYLVNEDRSDFDLAASRLGMFHADLRRRLSITQPGGPNTQRQHGG